MIAPRHFFYVLEQEILAALIDNGRKADDLRARANDDQKLQLAVIFELYVAVIQLNVHFHSSTTSKKVSGCAGSKGSFAHITVTRFSVSDKLIILCV